MTLELTDKQREAIRRGEAVRVDAQELGEVVVVRACAFEGALEDEREKAALATLARKAADQWAAENPY